MQCGWNKRKKEKILKENIKLLEDLSNQFEKLMEELKTNFGKVTRERWNFEEKYRRNIHSNKKCN